MKILNVINFLESYSDIIVIDGGSEDKTISTIKLEHKQEYEPFTVIPHTNPPPTPNKPAIKPEKTPVINNEIKTVAFEKKIKFCLVNNKVISIK